MDLKNDYPWIQTPLIVSAPMRLISFADMAVEVSKAGGIGFISAGTDVDDLHTHLQNAANQLENINIHSSSQDVLPVGIGFINWGASLPNSLPLIAQYRPAAVWFFAPSSLSSLQEWTTRTRTASPATRIWVQIGSVKEALEVVSAVQPDVLIVQGTDAGGHGLVQGAGLIALLPEVSDTVEELCKQRSIKIPVFIAAGGIAEGRGAAAAIALGAEGVAMGTRFLASPEASIAKGYRDEVLRATDGGQTTIRTKLYDSLRGTTGWPVTHNGRGVINRSFQDAMDGMSLEDNKKLYNQEMEKGDEGWGVQARMTTYAGSAVGLVREIKSSGEIVREVRDVVTNILGRLKNEVKV